MALLDSERKRMHNDVMYLEITRLTFKVTNLSKNACRLLCLLLLQRS
jgi:hypothetical protein